MKRKNHSDQNYNSLLMVIGVTINDQISIDNELLPRGQTLYVSDNFLTQ